MDSLLKFIALLAKHLCLLFIKMPSYFVVSEDINTYTVPSPPNECCGSSKRLKFHCSQLDHRLLPQEFPIPSVRGWGEDLFINFSQSKLRIQLRLPGFIKDLHKKPILRVKYWF